MADAQKMTIMIPKSVHRAAKIKAATCDVSLSEVIRSLLAKWLAGEIEVKPGE